MRLTALLAFDIFCSTLFCEMIAAETFETGIILFNELFLFF